MSNISENQFVYAVCRVTFRISLFAQVFTLFSTFAEVTMNSSIPQWHYYKEYRLTASPFSITPRYLEGYDLRVTHGLGRPFQVYDITIIFY